MKSTRIIATCALVALSWASTALGQVQIAGTLQVSVDATTQPVGTFTSLPNNGAMGGVFLGRTANTAPIQIIALGGNGTRGVLLDGNQVWLGHYTNATGGGAVPASTVPTFVGQVPVFSVEVWMYKATINDETGPVSWGTRTAGQNVSCNWGRNTGWGGFSWQGGGYDYGWVSVPTPGAWHHLVWTYDGAGNLSLYRDGVLDRAAYQSATVNVAPDYNILIGAQHNGANFFGAAAGVLGKVRIHDGVLTGAQVLNNYNVEKAGFVNGTPAVALAAPPLHRYSFALPATNDATGLVIPDTGTLPAAGVVKGTAATASFDGTQLIINGGSSATSAYVDLPNGLLSSLSSSNAGPGQVSLELWVEPRAASRWAELLYFGSSSIGEVLAPGGSHNGANGIVIPMQVDNNQEQSGIRAAVGDRTISARLLGSRKHIVVTWDELSNAIKLYHEGIQVGEFVSNVKMNAIADVNNWLGRSGWSGDNNAPANYREFRIYGHLLSPAEVRRNYISGPEASPSTSLLAWNGNVDGNWNTTTANWLSGGSSANYIDGSAVQLDDSAVGTTSLSLAQAVAPASVVVANSSKAYSLSGAGKISGTGTLTKAGGNDLTLASTLANDYTGPTMVTGGKLIVSSLANGGLPSAIGASSSDVTNLLLGATLSYQGTSTTIDRGFLVSRPSGTLETANDLNVAGAIRSASMAGFVKAGAGKLILSNPGSNHFGGGAVPGLNVAQGTLVLSGANNTNRVQGETWIGGTTASAGHMIISNATLLPDTWVGVGRGNGSNGYASTLTLQDGRIIQAANGLALGFNPAALSNNAVNPVLTLNGASSIFLPGNLQVGESVGSSGTATLNGTSWIRHTGLRMGMSAGSTGVVTIAGSAAITNVGGYSSIGTGSSANPAGGGVGVLTIKDNGAYYSTGDFNVTDLANSVGTVEVQGNGLLSSAGTIFIGKAEGSSAVMNQSGGTTMAGGWVAIGRFYGVNYGHAMGSLNVSGGVFMLTNSTTSMNIGEDGNGTLNLSGTGLVIATNNIRLGVNSGAVGTINLNGGTLSTKQILKNNASAQAYLNFDGGKLHAAPDANLNFLSGLDFVSILPGGATIDSGANNIVVGQDLNGAGGGLTKLGVGELRLAGFNNYTGPTLVNAGTLAFVNTAIGAGDYTVADGATLTLQRLNQGVSTPIASLKAGTTTGATLNFELGTFGNPTEPQLAIAGAFTTAGTVAVNIDQNSALAVGTFPLIQYGTIGGSGQVVLGSLPPGVTATLGTNIATSTIEITVTVVFQPRWEGLAGGFWDINVTTNWIDRITGLPQYFFQGTTARFDDMALGTTNVNLVTAVSPGNVVVDNSVLPNYVFEGVGRITGSGSLLKQGTGALTVKTTNNNYTGSTTIDGGGSLVTTVANNLGTNSALRIGTGTLGVGAANQRFSTVTVTNGSITSSGGTVTAASYSLDAGSINAVLAGGSLTTFGTNTDIMAVSGLNTYTGRTMLAGSTLAVTSLANGGSPSGVGTSSANPTNLVFNGGGLSYVGPATTTDRGYAIMNGGLLSASGDLTLLGPVSPGPGIFVKSGPAKVTYSRPDTNILTTGGYYVGQGTVQFVDPIATSYTNSLQTNRINGDLWVGFDQLNAGNVVVSNTSLAVSAYLALDRGNGTLGLSSKVTLYNALLTAGNVSMGYANGIAGNSSLSVITLRGNSMLTSANRVLLGENLGADCTMVLADNSSYIQNAEWFAVGNSGKATLILSNNAYLRVPGDYNLGDITDGNGTVVMSGNVTNLGATLYVAKGANSLGLVNQSGGYMGRSAGGGDWRIANNATAVGTYNLSGGIFDCPNNFQIGASGTGTWNQNGGVAYSANYPVVGRFAGSTGFMNVSGGVFNQTGGGQLLIVGEEGNGTLTITAAGLVNCVGGLSVGHTATGVGTVNLDGGTLSTRVVQSQGTSGMLNFNGGVLQANANNATFMGSLTMANVLAGGAFIDSSSNTVSIAQPLLDGGTGGGLTKLGTGTVFLNGTNTYTGMTFVNNGALGGSGVIAGSVTVAAAGTLAPGAGLGTLTINGNLALNGNLAVDVNGSLTPNSDLVAVGGALSSTGAGTISVAVAGPALVVGNTFQVFNKPVPGAAGMTFATSPGLGLAWTNKLAIDGTIAIVAGPSVDPTPTTLTAVFTPTNVTLSWPSTHKGWNLQVQTNLLSVGLSNNWFTVPGSSATNSVTIPLSSTDPTLFYRLQYQIP